MTIPAPVRPGASITPGGSVAIRTVSASDRKMKPRAVAVACIIYAAGWTSISLATLVGRETGSPNSRSVFKCPSIPSRIFYSVSSRVLPVVMQPGRSGTYAAQLLSACSKITAYLTLIVCSPIPPISGSLSEYQWEHRRRDRNHASVVYLKFLYGSKPDPRSV